MKHIWWFLWAAWLLFPAFSGAETLIKGRGCVSFGTERTLEEARLVVRGVAIRRAIESTGVLDIALNKGSPEFVEDITQVLRSGHLSEVRVILHEEHESSVCETVEVGADVEGMRRVVERELERRLGRERDPGFGDNGCLEILAIEEEEDRYGRRVTTVARVMRATGSLHTPELRQRRPCFKVCIDYFGPGGVPAGGDALFVDESEEGVVAGEIRALSFHVPGRITSYRIWLPPDGQALHAAPSPVKHPRARTLRPINDVSASVESYGLRLDVVSDGPISSHKQFFMINPPRLVIDLPGAWERPGFHAAPVESPLAERIRIGHHPDKLRLVLDLLMGDETPSTVVRETPTGLVVEIRPH